MNRLVLAFFIYSVLGLVTMPAYGRFVVMQDELWATNAAIHASISSGDMALSNQVAAVAGLMAVETASRAAGDSLGSNHVHSVESALSNRINSVESALSGTSNSLAGAIASLGTNLSHSIEYTTAVSNKFNTAITNETAARIDGDSSISNLVVYLEGGLAQEVADRIAGDLEGSNHVDSVGLILSNRVSSVEDLINSASNELAQAISTERQTRIAGDITNHNEIVGVQAYSEAVSNKFDSAVYALATNLHTKVSTNHFGDVTIHGGIVVTDNIYMGEGKNLVLTDELDPVWSSVSDEVTQNAGQGATAYGWGDHKLAGYANTNGSIYVVGNVTATSFIGDGSQLSGIQVDDKVSTNHVGDVEITGNVSATSFIGDGSQLSGISGGLEFPELTIYSSEATTSIPFTKDYKYYQVVVTNTTDISFDYSGIGAFAENVLEFQIRLVLANPLADAVTIPAEGVSGIKYVGDIDISATQANTAQHLGMLMYSTNNVLLSHWFFDEP